MKPFADNNRRSGRLSRGNMMAMVALVVGLVVFVLLIAVALMLVFSSSSRGKNAADELAIGAAKVLNADDRQGRVNILVERSRELVFSSRQTYSDLSRRLRYLEPLARQLVDESRQGAQSVEDERLAVLAASEGDLSALLKDDAKRLSERSSINLNWLKTMTPRIIACAVGNLKDSDSNVQMPQEYDELRKWDLEGNFVNRVNKLYKGNIDAKLPSPDDDLHFHLSALPAPVKGTISGARLLSDEKFEEQSEIDLQSKRVSFKGTIPSALRLKLSTQVSASGRGELSGNVANSSIALTNGGSPAPDEEP